MGHAVPISEDEPTGYTLSASQKSLIVSILSAGTFFGALIGGQCAEWIGRRLTIMVSCLIFAIGVAIQVAASTVNTLAAGRLIAGLGVGGVSVVVILYVSEISPKRVRGLLVSGYQWAITIGLLIAACVDQGTQHLDSPNSYRIPIALQLIWAAILALGLFLLPESPRYLVKKGRPESALRALSRVRGQPVDSPYLQAELAEIQANFEHEMKITSTSWLDCFKGGLRPSSNLGRVLIGTSLQMFQQWTGVNFICKPVHMTQAWHLSLTFPFSPSLLRHNILPAIWHPQRLSDHHHRQRRQCLLHPSLLLHHRTLGPPHPPHLRRHPNAHLRIHRRHRWHCPPELQRCQ
jgi:MFS transporter, SP family, sugar:H+ symporter